MPIPLDPSTWGQIVLAVLGIISTIVTCLTGIAYLRVRRKSERELEKQRQDAEERLKQKDLELEKARQATARANADLERTMAETQRVRDQGTAEVIQARSSAKQQTEMLDMVRVAFNRVADSQISNAEAQVLTAQALNKNSETIGVLTKTVTDGQDRVMESLLDITLKLGDLPKTIDGNLNPLYEQVKKLGEAANALSVLVQSLQLTLLAQFKPPAVENGIHASDEAKGTTP